MTDQDQDILELSTGVRLQILTPSPVLVHNVMKAIAQEEPKPPKVFIEAKGREEENPSDPDYTSAYQTWLADAGLRSLRALLPTGSRLESKPEGMVGPEDEDFVDLMESMGEAPASGRHSRYVQWVLLVACGEYDLKELATHLMRRAGVREEDVREAQDLFPGLTERGADNGASAEPSGQHGDRLRSARPRAGANA